METLNKYENFPLWMVMLSNAVTVAIYTLGFIIMQRLGWIIAILYMLYILIFEYRLLRYHCVNCFYWGKICGFGKGKVSALLFEKGEIAKFCQKEMSWKDLIPDLLISLIPFIAGIVLLIINFDLLLLSTVILLLLLTTSGNGFIRSALACKFCAQREIGCPAEKLFSKSK